MPEFIGIEADIADEHGDAAARYYRIYVKEVGQEYADPEKFCDLFRITYREGNMSARECWAWECLVDGMGLEKRFVNYIDWSNAAEQLEAEFSPTVLCDNGDEYAILDG